MSASKIVSGVKPVWSKIQLVLLAILIAVNVIQGVSLFRRVSGGATDFTVFYNTGVLLRQGAGPQIYAGKDESTEWLRTIPPFGQFLLHPLSALSIQGAAIVWALVNFVLIAVSCLAWFQICQRLDGKRRLMCAMAPWFVLIFLALSPGCLQVGQYSVLFAACWVLYHRLLCSRYSALAESALAVPAAVKLYPGFVLFAPGLRQGWRPWVGFSLWMFVAAALPALVYGPKTPALTVSFWDHAIVSPNGRVAESIDARSASNQGIDTIGLRYLTPNQPLQRRFPELPHANWSVKSAMRLVNAVRLGVLVLTFAVAIRYIRRRPRRTRWDTLLLMGLFSATLFAILPGAKSRYAIYEVLAFVPLLCRVYACRRLGLPLAARLWTAALIACLLGVISFMPAQLRAFGLGFFGAMVLWAINLVLVAQWSAKRRLNPHSPVPSPGLVATAGS